MKKSATIFLQGVIVLIGMVALIIMIRFPLTEGRAANLDLFSIYTDLFVLYGFAASIPFFIALYKAFKFLGYVRRHNVFSPNSVRALRSIRYCAMLLSILLVLAGLYIRLFHDADEDPAGFLAVSMVTAFVAIVVAVAVAVFENIIQKGMDIQSENEQLHKELKK